MPSGFERPSRATVMASNPIVPAMPSVRYLAVPSSWTAPARPARAPDGEHHVDRDPLDEMPAVREAFGLNPTARYWNPIRERDMSHQTNTAARIAMMNPEVHAVLRPEQQRQLGLGSHRARLRLGRSRDAERLEA